MALEAGGAQQTIGDVIGARLRRRDMLKAALVVSAAATLPGSLTSAARAQTMTPGRAPTLTFQPIAPDAGDTIMVPPGYRADVLIRWGEPLFGDVPPFDLQSQTAQLQEQRFGFNADFIMFVPLPPGSTNPNDGLLWVNHEYTDGQMMFPGYDAKNPSVEQVDIELAAHGGSVLRVHRDANGAWSYDRLSRWNRRITATTPIRFSGPAAGSSWLQTGSDPSGSTARGMLNNCGGGVTPWGTILTAEENFNQYFGNVSALPDDDARKGIHRRYGVTAGPSERSWEMHYPERFDVAQNPNEPFKYGWIVEIDPYDPQSMPTKRTALGRFKHEAAAMTLSPAGHAAVYLGDDERFDYVYKFVSAGTYDANSRANNMGLLDNGTLYVARFSEDGSGTWLPLVYDQGPLTAEKGFTSQADVLVKARLAGDALGATKMDRPEDVEVNPATGKVYVVMTNNTNRGTDGNAPADAANPRARNAWGHILELVEDGNDHASTAFRWNIFLLAGDPANESTYFAGFPKDQVSAFACPDNICFDTQGNLWVATDGQPNALRVNDGIYGVPTTGWDRGHVKQFLSGVAGSEIASLVVGPQSQALFLSVQHPGEGGSLAQPTSRWPDGDFAQPSVVVVSRQDGGPIGV